MPRQCERAAGLRAVGPEQESETAPPAVLSDDPNRVRTADRRLATLLGAAAIAARPCEAILFSGGLDTSIVASLAVRCGLRLAITVVTGDEAPDLAYANAMAAQLGLEHVVLRRSPDDLAASLPDLIRILGTFDGMFLRNDVVVLEGLREVARRGLTCCWTGDGADELFAGYSFVFRKSPAEIESTIAHLARTMQFNGPRLGDTLGIDVRSPYLDPQVVDLARSFQGEDLVSITAASATAKRRSGAPSLSCWANDTRSGARIR